MYTLYHYKTDNGQRKSNTQLPVVRKKGDMLGLGEGEWGGVNPPGPSFKVEERGYGWENKSRYMVLP